MRRWTDRGLLAVTAMCALAACGLFAGILGAIAFRGLPAMNWTFVFEQAREAGASGGVWFQLVGTLILVGTALLVSAPPAIALALVQGVYLRNHRARNRLTTFLYVLNGVPSILFGLFGMMVFVKFFGWGKSWLTGGLLLGMMIVPTVTIALVERIASLPEKYIEAAAGLGLKESQIVWSVVLPQSIQGWVTGSLLGLARAAGETAPIMFTATIFSGAGWPQGIKESPVLSLPYHIFVLAQDSFDPAVAPRVWGAALVLLGLVFCLSLIALPMRLKIHEEAHHG